MRRLWPALCAGALAGLAPPAAAAPRPRPGGELRILLSGPPGELDPARAASAQDLVVARALHATLYDLDAAGAPRPALAEALPEPSADGREVRVRLRAGLRFHDGAPISAADVVESLSRLLRPEVGSPHAYLAAPLEGAEVVREGKARAPAGLRAVSDLEVRLVLAHPYPALARALCSPPTAVVHGSGAALSGAGPFRLVARSAEALRLAPFEGHHRGRPWADGAVLSWPDPAAAARRLARGEAELALRPEAVPGLVARDTSLATLAVASISGRRLGAAAQGLRGALLALDPGELARMLRGPGRPLASLLPPGNGPPGTAPHASGPLPSRLALLTPASLRPLADRIQVKLFDRGVRVAVEAVPDGLLPARLAVGAHDLALVPVALASEVPALALAQVISALAGPARGARALRELSAADAAPAEVAARAAEELPAVALAAVPLRASARPAVQGLPASALPDLADLWLLPEHRRGP